MGSRGCPPPMLFLPPPPHQAKQSEHKLDQRLSATSLLRNLLLSDTSILKTSSFSFSWAEHWSLIKHHMTVIAKSIAENEALHCGPF